MARQYRRLKGGRTSAYDEAQFQVKALNFGVLRAIATIDCLGTVVS